MSEVDVIQLIKEERARTGEGLKECKERLTREGRIPKPAKQAKLSTGDEREVTIEAAAMIAVATLRPDLMRGGGDGRARLEAVAERLKPMLAEVLDELS
jgi:hypothetical protein